MTREQKLELKKIRLNKLRQNGKNIESNGVIRKLEKEIRKLSE